MESKEIKLDDNKNISIDEKLFYQFYSLYFNLVSTPQVENLFSFLKHHKDYDPKSFWTQKLEGKNGDHPLLILIDQGLNTFTALEPLVNQELENINYPTSIYNMKGENGDVLFHRAWAYRDKKANRSTYFYNDGSLDKKIFEIMKLTDKEHLTWLDKEGSHPGDGLLSEIIRSSKSPSNSALNDMAKYLGKLFPRDNMDNNLKKNQKSPWLSVQNQEQAKILIDAGQNINSIVDIRGVSIPAWEYLYMLSPTTNMYNLLISSNVDDEDRLTKLHKEQQNWCDVLIPKNKRSKIGYVNLVKGFSGQDIYGRSSLDYLANYRADLIDLLDTNTDDLSQDRLKELFCEDRLGFGFLTRMLISNNYNNKYRDLMAYHHLPIKWGFEDKGWFHANVVNQKWFSLLKSRHLSDTNPTSVIEASNSDPEWLFGSAKQQEKWIEIWDKFLDNLNNEEWKSVSDKVKKPFFNQIRIFFEDGHNWKGKMNDTLYSQLHFASWLCFSFLFYNVQEMKNFNIHTTHTFPKFNMDIEPPSIWTEKMIEYWDKKKIKFDNRYKFHLKNIDKNEDEIVQHWEAFRQKYEINRGINQSVAKKEKNQRVRKM